MSDTTETVIEFTDRYGGRTPSWLRGCHGPCEAMGCYPQHEGDASMTAHERAEVARLRAECPTEDGWYFVRCPECDGSGRVSLARTLARIPRWLWRAARHFWEFRPSAPVWQGHSFGWARRLWVAFDVTVLCDLRRLRN